MEPRATFYFIVTNFNGHKWPVATILDSEALGKQLSHPKRHIHIHIHI